MRNAECDPKEQFDPDARNQFVIIPGRYYSVMFFVRLPKQDNDLLRLGGDCNALIWRKDETLTHWVIQYRFRYYKSRDAWQSGDEKHWFGGEIDGTEELVVAGFETVMEALSAATGFPVERIEIHGNNERFFQAVREQSPPWLHVGISDEQAGKGGNPETN